MVCPIFFFHQNSLTNLGWIKISIGGVFFSQIDLLSIDDEENIQDQTPNKALVQKKCNGEEIMNRPKAYLRF